METKLELNGEFDENNNRHQVLSVQLISTDSNNIKVRLDASIGIRPVDSVEQVVSKLRKLADAFEDADKKI